jgi:hypothetical protein
MTHIDANDSRGPRHVTHGQLSSIVACELRGLTHEELACLAANLLVSLKHITRACGNKDDGFAYALQHACDLARDAIANACVDSL